MKRPTVTVCIATCNQRDYIEQCVRSVLEQEADADVRILIGDDASIDGTSEIVAQIAAADPGKIRHFLRAQRMGASANMRDVISRADGNLVARVDGDDYWLPGKLARQLAFMQAHPDCAAVYTNAITVDEQGTCFGLFNDVGDGRFDLAAMLRRGNFLVNSSVLFRSAGKHAWLDVTVPQIDYRAHLWHARQGYLAQIGEPLVAYRVNAAGAMTSTQRSNDFVRDLYWEAIMSVPPQLVTPDDIAHGIADFLRRIASRAMREKRWSLTRTWFPRALAASPRGATRTTLLVLGSAIRATWLEAVGTLRRGADGKRIHVRHHR